VDDQLSAVSEFQPDDLQEVPGVVRSNGKDLGRIGVRLKIHDGEGVVDGVEDGSVVDAMLVSCPIDFPISIS
jgi:hypothetical protein